MTHRRDDVAGAGRPNLNQALLSLEEEGLPPPPRPSYSGFWLTCVLLAVVALVVWYVRAPTATSGGVSQHHDDRIWDLENRLQLYRRDLETCEDALADLDAQLSRCRSQLDDCD